MPKFSGLASGPGVGPGHPLTALGSTPRASYNLCSYNTQTNTYYTGALDANLRPLFQVASQTWSCDQITANYTFARYAATTTRSQVGSNTDHLQSTMLTGEFGFDGVVFRERNYVAEASLGESYGNGLQWANRAFVNSDHLDRSRVLTLSSGVLVSTPLHAPVVRSLIAPPYFRPEVSYKTLGGTGGASLAAGNTSTTMYGSASFNRVRKELVYVCWNSNTSQFDVYIWKNVDLDAWGMDVSRIPDAPDVTKSFDMAAIGGVNYLTNRAETVNHPKVVLVDDGSIFIGSMATTYTTNNQGGFRLFKVTRAAADASIAVTLATTVLSASNTYGAENDIRYGSRAIQDKSGRIVMMFSAYYYYGAGINSFTIDKRTSAFISYQNADSGNGYQPFKFGANSIGFSNWGSLHGNTTGNTQVIRPGGETTGTVPLRVQGPTIPHGMYPATWNDGNYFQSYVGICPVWELPVQPSLPV